VWQTMATVGYPTTSSYHKYCQVKIPGVATHRNQI
jgi:hypothetical protein